VITFDQFLVEAPPNMSANQPWSILEEVMENLADLMQRLLEIQSGEKRSPKLIAEDERLMSGLWKRYLAGNPTQRLEAGENRPGPQRFKA